MTFVYILLVLILLSLVFLILKNKKANSKEISDQFFNQFNQKFPEILNQANTNLINLANEKIGTDLNNKKTAIEDLVKRVLDELKVHQQKLETAESCRVGSFNSLREAIDNNRKITEQLSTTTESLRNVLSNNQLRGAFGEKVAEDLLKQIGFVIGTSYSKQKSHNGSRPDFTIYLPDKTKINVDSKFPYSNLVKMSEAKSDTHKEQYLKLFKQDIKKKINEVTTRDYIDPEQNTVDFVVVFIPNEMVFSFIYEKFPSLLEEAFNKKVVFAGPFSFTAILRMVNQAYDNFRYQKNVQNIISYIRLFEKEFYKYNEEFGKLGIRIDSLSKQYNQINSTRTTKLLRVIDKIKLDDHSETKNKTIK